MSIIHGSAKGSANASFYTHPIEQSLRFNDDDSAYLSWTPASAGNRKTWTFSTWVKRGNLGTDNQHLIRSNSPSETNIRFNSDNTFIVVAENKLVLKPSALYRDVSSWYHIVVAMDTTQATASNRTKLYINGEQVTSFSAVSYPTQNYDTSISSTNPHYIGQSGNTTEYFDGYLAETHFIDGTAYTASDFGETKNGVWIPKQFAGTYGTNGFYLKYADGGALGTDSSGNSNTWTATNLASTDVMLDSPTNNFATLNPLSRINWIGQDYATIAEGNLRNNGSNNGNHIDSTMAFSSGKWYWETMVGQYGFAGVRATHAVYNADATYRYYNNDGNITYGNPASSSYGSTIGDYASGTSGDVIGVAIDCDSNEIKFYRNNTLLHTESSIGSWEYSPITGCAATSNQYINFGQDSSFAGNKTPQGYTDANGKGDFYYAPPTGYLALCTANLPEPAISPANGASPSDHFNTVIWSGDNTSPFSLTGVGFQPDFTWSRPRNAASGWAVIDAVRGVSKQLASEQTGAEWTDTSFGQITSYDSDGFTAIQGDYPGYEFGNFNMSGRTYVMYNWLADNTSGSSNTDGTITSTVSANPTAGFSIVSYTGTGSAATVGHGLSSAPEMIIVKARDVTAATGHWSTYHASLGNTSRVWLNLTNASASSSAYWNNTSPTSSVFSLGTEGSANESSKNYIAYCFHSVDGYSKFGSYTGNGSTDGPFVYTGFRPAFVMWKRTDAANGWYITDSTRTTYNPQGDLLVPNTSNAESADIVQMDFLSNGFKVVDTNTRINASGGTYIYMAFADDGGPFKYSVAR